jgi:hypothetical protein
MADSRQDRDPIHRALTPEVLLAVGALLFYGWEFVPDKHQALAWNAAGSIVRLWLLWTVMVIVRARGMLLVVAAWWTAEELMVAGCSLARIWWAWTVAPGQAQCSALLSLDVGALTILVVAALVGAIVRRR